MPRLLMISFNNAKPGRDDDFNRWYDEQHLRDVLGVKHFVSAQRFCIDPAAGGASFAFGYMTIFEVDSDDIPALTAALAERSGTDLMPLTDAMTDQRLRLWAAPIGLEEASTSRTNPHSAL
ncbi:hypothetical protein [Aquamicrobium sp. LC103]|uniref:hypothetical protein n=1 Tax=Aquamicrobium sp. LC103 TaxID=1120658 RepID=UPI00063E8D25|nr:hypothetical protein [Aquamicrobium sp. LC103]TKT74503.1 hypothetical protein XW59_024010 [Aquamicrobium sp. LC103]